MFALSITGESITKATDTEAVQEPSSSKAIEESPQETVNPRNTKETGLVHRLKMALSSAIREPKASRIIFENSEAAALKTSKSSRSLISKSKISWKKRKTLACIRITNSEI